MTEAVYLANTFIQTIVLAFLFCELLEPRRSFVTILLFWFGGMVLTRAAVTFGLLSDGHSVYFRELLPVTVVLFAFKDRLRRKLAAYLMMWVVGLISELVGYVVMWRLVFYVDADYALSMDGKEPIGVWAGRLLVCGMMLVTSIIIIMIWHRKKLRQEHLISRMLLIIACTAAHAVCLSFFYYFNSEDLTQTDNLVQVLLQALMYTVIFIQYYSSKRMSAIAAREAALSAAEAEKENEQRYLELADAKLRDINALRDDLRAQLSDLKELIDDREHRLKAEAIMDEMSDRLSQIKAVNYCDDQTLNAVLTLKLNDPKVSGIHFQTTLKDCTHSGTDSCEMCSLVSNMLDNAIESCLAEPDPPQTFIEIKSGIKAGFFVIRVTNTCTAVFAPKTAKGEGHGYGLKIIEEICRRHDGEFTVTQRDGKVISSAFLKVVEE